MLFFLPHSLACELIINDNIEVEGIKDVSMKYYGREEGLMIAITYKIKLSMHALLTAKL